MSDVGSASDINGQTFEPPVTEPAAKHVPEEVIEIEDVAPLATVRPDLGRGVAAFLALLFLIIAYHIQHPTLLFRAQFGLGFRDVQEEGLQEAVTMALIISVILLVGSWRKLWVDRQEPTGRLRLAMVGGGIGLFVLHMALLVFRDFHIFTELYNLRPEVFADELMMSRSQARALLDPVKALHGMALLAGAGLASALYLWSPWESARRYWQARGKPNKSTPPLWATVMKDLTGPAVLFFWLASYLLQSPLWLQESGLAHDLQDAEVLVGGLLFVSAAALIGVQRGLWARRRKVGGRLRLVMAIGLGLYVLHSLAVLWADYNVFYDYYGVDKAIYTTELLSESARIRPLEAADWAAVLAGVALASLIYLWSPWEHWRAYLEAARRNVAAIVVAVIVIVAWEQAVELFKIGQFLLPRPSVIWDTFKEVYPSLIAGSWFTFQNALRGFVYGCAAGILTGILSSRFIHFSRAILPLAIAANAVPIIAFAPISNAWFGLTDPDSKVAIVAVLCYFPAMISTVRGLTLVEPIQLELMRSYAASEMQIFRYLRLPNALPLIYSALKLSTSLSMIGAIVAEYFGGSPHTALGFRIKNDAALLRMTESWSAIMVASLLGIGFYMLISMTERTMMPWYRSFRGDSR